MSEAAAAVTMFSGCHPRIVLLAIPSLLGNYANASQAFESLNRAYESLRASWLRLALAVEIHPLEEAETTFQVDESGPDAERSMTNED